MTHSVHAVQLYVAYMADPIVELIVPADPATSSEATEVLTLTKKQVRNVLEGRPVRGKGSRVAPSANTLRTRKVKNATIDSASDVGGENAGASGHVQSRQSTSAATTSALPFTFHTYKKEHADADREKRKPRWGGDKNA